MKRVNFLLVIVFLTAFYGCETFVIEEPEPPQAVTFTDVQKVFNDNCTGCHDGVTANPVLLEGSSYNALMTGEYVDTANPEQSPLYLKIESGEHGYLSKSGRNTILKWIQDGALNN